MIYQPLARREVFELVEVPRRYMASMRDSLQSIVLVALFILGGSFSTLVNSATWDENEISEYYPMSSISAGESMQVQIASQGAISSQLKLQLPALETLQELDMSISPTPLSRPSAFTWNNWNHPDASIVGIDVIDGVMLSSGESVISLIDYDFTAGVNGWTTTGPGNHNTLACGVNGSSGGSLALHSSAMSFVSPSHDLSAISEAYVAGWAIDGSNSCNEPPDANEDLYFEYQDAAKVWHQLQRYVNSGYSTQVARQLFQQLPADALHSDFKIRARLSSATCGSCDYWFVDDVSIMIPGTSVWSSPSFGHASNATESREIGPYSTMYIDSFVPLGASLEWTVVDAWSGDSLPGLVNRTGPIVDLSSIDWETHEALRIKVLITQNAAGESPSVYSITGGGRIIDQFYTSPLLEGWTTNATGWPVPNWNPPASGSGVKDTTSNSPPPNSGSSGRSTSDTDGDGYDDDVDTCVNTFGTSNKNGIFGCPDSDGDGYANTDDDFPNDASEWLDSDGDGYGNNADDCDNSFGSSNQNGIFGCPDSDGDGYANTDDDFPNDASEWLDSDGDGVGNNADEFPNDASEWTDSDSDGFGDNLDNCDNTVGSSNQNGIFGCPDADGDGYADTDDEFPNNPFEWIDSDSDGAGDNSDIFPTDDQRWHPIWSESSYNLSGRHSESLTSPTFTPGVPIQGLLVTASKDGGIMAEYSIDGEAWQEFSLNVVSDFNDSAHNIQFRFTGTTRGWSISSLEIDLVPALLPKSPNLDVDLDGDVEWQFSDDAIGTWGWQDVFADGSKEVIVSQTMSTSTKVPVWIPKDEVKHFQVSAIDHLGNGIDGLALWVGNQVVGELSSNNETLLSLSLDQNQLDSLATELDFRPAIFDQWGQAYVYGEIELIASSGYYSMLGLGVGHHPTSVIDVEALDPFVKSINAARLSMGGSGNHEIPLPLQSDSRSQMRVDVNTISGDSSTMITRIDVANDSATLTPSYRWRELTTTIDVTSSVPGAMILDLESDDNISQWIIPFIGGNVISSGDSEVLIFDDPAFSIVNNGVEYEITVRFRTAQSWDDQQSLVIDARLRLINGIVSMPARYEWGGSVLAVENDLIINGITWNDEAGVMANNHIYLRYDENISMDITFGFENGNIADAPYDNEYDLIITRGGQLLANLSEIGSNTFTFNDTVPFLAGDLEWNVTLTATAGGGNSDTTSVNRTFVIDSLSPKVTSANIRHFDHRESSTQQLVSINVTDQPVLPSSLTLMVWREWADDVNGDGQPGPGEYLARGLTVPQSIETNYGFYTAKIDDTLGFNGMKVAGYVTGSDASGLEIKSGGSDAIGQFLFMYQINADGAPDVDSDTFSWQHGRSAWLHPNQAYTLDIEFEEPNGVSDVERIEVELASNIQSDPLLVVWSQTDKRCTTTSNHIIISGCTIYSGSTVATAFEPDLTLSIDLSFSWSMPELGESRREPSVKIIDRAGAQDHLTYPESRWRFSPAMKVGENVELWVESGTIEQDGARVSASSNVELSGSVVFAESDEVPQFECTARVNLDGNVVYPIVENGRFTASVRAPSETGSYPLTWAVGCLPAEGRDATNQITSVYWIGVDASGPMPTTIDAPRPGSVLEAQTQLLQLEISDDFGIDTQSVEVIWWVTSIETGLTITEGSDEMTLIGTENSGQKVAFEGIMDLSEIDIELQYEKLQCHIRLVGRDLAGNNFQSSPTFNSANKPFATWDLHHITPEFDIQNGGVEISKANLEVDETAAIQVAVLNTGDREGEIEVTVELVKLDGSRELIKRDMVKVGANGLENLVIDWRPTESGIQWIEASLPDSEPTHSEWINVNIAQEDGVFDGVMGNANPVLLGISIFMVVILVGLGLTWLRITTASTGGRDDHLYEMVDSDEFEGDEYEDYDDDDDDGYDED